MSDQEGIAKLLDELDIKLMRGDIDLPTYSALKTKWEARLGTTKLASAISEIGTFEVAKVKCPSCGAPLQQFTEDVDSYTCSFCGGTCQVAQIETYAQKIEGMIKDWISEVLPDATSAVDPAARHYIFEERVFPELERDYNRFSEIYGEMLDSPFVGLPLFREFDRFSPTTGLPPYWQPADSETLYVTSAKAEHSDVAAFASSQNDRYRLQQISARTRWLAHIYNGRYRTQSYSNTDFLLAKQNYEEASQVLQPLTDSGVEDDEVYFGALQQRSQAAALVCGVVAKALDNGTEGLQKELSAGEELLNRAMESIKDSSVPLARRTLLEDGIEIDLEIVSFLKKCLSVYEEVGTAVDFKNYLETLDTVLNHYVATPTTPEKTGWDWKWLERHNTPSKFGTFLDHLVSCYRSTLGEEKVYVTHRGFEWSRSLIEEERKKPGFLNKKEEKVSAVLKFWDPYWLVDVRFMLKKGVLWMKKGEEHSHLAFCSSTFNQDRTMLAKGNYSRPMSKLFRKTPPEVQQVADTIQNAVPSGGVVLPPSTTPAEVDRLFKNSKFFYERIANASDPQLVSLRNAYSNKGFDGNVKDVWVEVSRLVFVPTIYVEYTLSDGSTRTVRFSGAGGSFGSSTIDGDRLQTAMKVKALYHLLGGGN